MDCRYDRTTRTFPISNPPVVIRRAGYMAPMTQIVTSSISERQPEQQDLLQPGSFENGEIARRV